MGCMDSGCCSTDTKKSEPKYVYIVYHQYARGCEVKGAYTNPTDAMVRLAEVSQFENVDEDNGEYISIDQYPLDKAINSYPYHE